MQLLNLLKKYLIQSQIYVSLMGTLFAVFFMLEQNMFRFPTVLLIFITYFSGYVYTKYQKHHFFKTVVIINIFGGLFSMVLIFLNHHELRIVKWIVIVVLGLLYNSDFLDKFIRNIPLLKVFYVGLTWALINSWLILPAFHWPIFMISLLYITALVLPFDIRDMKEDNITTFPRLIGVQATKYLAYLFIFLAMVTAIHFLKPTFAFAFFMTGLITYFFVYFSENSNRESYFSFWVETCSAIPFLIVLLLQYF